MEATAATANQCNVVGCEKKARKQGKCHKCSQSTTSATAEAPKRTAAERVHEFVMLTAVNDKHEFHVHAAGCRDIARGVNSRKYWEAGWVQHADSAAALVEGEVAVFEDQQQGWTAKDFKVHACAK